MNLLNILRGGLVGLGVVGTLHAGTNNFYVPTFRGEPGSQAGYWENFTVPVGAPGNLANFGNNTTSLLTQSQPGAIIAGGAAGNIYNMPSASEFTVSYSGAFTLGLVVLQARTVGTELAYNSVLLNYDGGSLSTTRSELDRSPFGSPGGPQGFFVSSDWQWDLTPLNVSSFSITFSAAETSLSFDAMTLDTQAVPEPSTWALFGVGTVVALLASRRKSHRMTY